MKLILIISLILSGIIQYPLEVIAQTKKPTNNNQPAQPARKPSNQKSTSRPVFVPPKPPPGLTPVSGRRAGMGSRGNCPGVEVPLTALVPLQKQKNASRNAGQSSIGIVEGRTTFERPHFLFYVPYTQKDLGKSSAEFILQDSKGANVYEQKRVALPSKAGVIGIPLPDTVKPLEVGQTYRWYFKIRCDQKTASVPVYVEGGIQRVSLNPNVTEQLKAVADPQQKIVIYAKEGIWFDALNMLAQIRQSSSEDASVKEDWQILLESVNLDNIAAAPFINSSSGQ